MKWVCTSSASAEIQCLNYLFLYRVKARWLNSIMFSGQQVFAAALDDSVAQQRVVRNIWHTECVIFKLYSGLQNDC